MFPAAAKFYQKLLALQRGIMNGPVGQPMHAELTLRGTTLMLGPENSAMGRRQRQDLSGAHRRRFL